MITPYVPSMTELRSVLAMVRGRSEGCLGVELLGSYATGTSGPRRRVPGLTEREAALDHFTAQWGSHAAQLRAAAPAGKKELVCISR